MTFVIPRSQAAGFGDFGAAVLAFAVTLKLWHDYAVRQPPEKAAEIQNLIGDLRNAADCYILSSIGPAPDFVPDYEIVDDCHIAEMCDHIASGASLS